MRNAEYIQSYIASCFKCAKHEQELKNSRTYIYLKWVNVEISVARKKGFNFSRLIGSVLQDTPSYLGA